MQALANDIRGANPAMRISILKLRICILFMSSLPNLAYSTETSSARMNEHCTIDAVIAIWRRVLKRSSIAPNENFFALGGNPQLATEVFREIAKISGRELPTVQVFQAPTIAQMVSLA